MTDENTYQAFVDEMHLKYPKMFSGSYGGFEIGEGWYQIIRALCSDIQAHINWRNKENADEVEQVVVEQIKEKFGGLRFYYTGGDSTIDGMVTIAEAWAEHTCEVCGNRGSNRSVGGWLTTLCDTHYNERLERMKERNNAFKN